MSTIAATSKIFLIKRLITCSTKYQKMAKCALHSFLGAQGDSLKIANSWKHQNNKFIITKDQDNLKIFTSEKLEPLLLFVLKNYLHVFCQIKWNLDMRVCVPNMYKDDSGKNTNGLSRASVCSFWATVETTWWTLWERTHSVCRYKHLILVTKTQFLFSGEKTLLET